MKVVSADLGHDYKESFFIHEFGMKLSLEHRSKIRKKLLSLETRAPALTAIHLKFTHVQDRINGELSIAGFGKSFLSVATGLSSMEVYKALEKDIDKQLMHWKRSRFIAKHTNFFSLKEERELNGGCVT